MKICLSLSILASLIFSSQLMAKVNVIYGEDNRLDVVDSVDSMMIENSKSTAAMISAGNLTLAGNITKISGKTLEDMGICESERFAKQIVAASCSGFLVADNILVTAGHCIRNEMDCKSNKWVFDYKIAASGQTQVSVPNSSIYSCKKVLEQKLETFSKNDYAVIELDRKVTDRKPLKFRRHGKIAKGAAVVVIGHPTGLPTKIADGAKVRTLAGKYFVANVDTFGGNSGSAVFSDLTGEVEGILVRGDTDYVRDSAKGCEVVNHCTDDGCRGEDITYITNIEILKKVQ